MSVKLNLHASDVVIRYIDTYLTPSIEQTQLWLSWFDTRELERLERFQKPEHRQRFLLSHALLRGVLAEFAPCHPAELEFTALPQGKPIVSTPKTATAPHFNLSHTHGLAAIAIARNPLGLDLEWLQRRGPEVTLAARYFTRTEYQDILSHPKHQQHRRLLSYWTLKEAYIKAEGRGLSMGLDSFEFEIPKDSPPQLRVLKPQAQSHYPWQFQQFEVASTHLLALAAVATKPGPVKIDCAAWTS